MAQISYGLLAFIFLHFSIARADQIPLAADACTHPPYDIHLFSKAPLVIYISNFLTLAEREHLKEIT